MDAPTMEEQITDESGSIENCVKLAPATSFNK